MERKARLKEALGYWTWIRYVNHVEDRLGLLSAAEKAGPKGIVANKTLAPYRRGTTGDWIKIKTTAGKALTGNRGKWNER